MDEGCTTKGDAVATKISTSIDNLVTTIETTFGISYSELLTDFLASDAGSLVTEARAQNIASFFPYLKDIRDEVASELSGKYGKSVTPNISLSESALSTIFGDDSYDQVPLDFYSVYTTSPNSNGFYNVDEIRADGASITNEGVLKRYYCILNDTSDCDTTTLNLNNIGNASSSFRRQSNIYKDNFVVDGVDGSIVIRGSETRGYRTNFDSQNNEQTESYCEAYEDIEFKGLPDANSVNPEYRYGNGRSITNTSDCSVMMQYPQTMSLSIEKQGRNLIFDDRSPTWRMSLQNGYLVTTNFVENKVYTVVDNDSLDAEPLIKEVKDLPFGLTKIDEIRPLISNNEQVFMYYSPDTSVDDGESFLSYYLNFTNFPKEDSFQIQTYYPSTGSYTENERIYGQAARDAFFDVLDDSIYDYGNMVGASPPVDTVLFRLYEEQIQVIDKLSADAEPTKKYLITPRYNKETGYIENNIEGSQISKTSIQNFFDGFYTEETQFAGQINVSEPFTSVEEITFQLFKGNSHSTNDDYFEIKVELKFETTDSGIQVSWLPDSVATFKFYDVESSGTTILTKEVTNDSGLDTFNISSGDYDFSNFLKLGLRWDQILAKFSKGELDGIKEYFENGTYSWKIDFGNYNFSLFDGYGSKGGMSSVLVGVFEVAEDNLLNAVYPEGSYMVNEGETSNMCFHTTMVTQADESMVINPHYRDEPGYIQDGEITFSSTTVSFPSGSNTACITITGVSDEILLERKEILEFTITGVSSGLVSGRSGFIDIIVSDD